MYKTLELTRHNGKEHDHSETLYISIHVTSVVWCYMVTWELGGGASLSYTNSGDKEPSDWYGEIKDAIIDNIIGTQTTIEDVNEYLTSEDGDWLLTFNSDDFAADQWDEHRG